VKTQVLIPAAGAGQRLGASVPKALVEVAGIPLLVRTLKRFAPLGLTDSAIVLVPPEEGHAFRAVLNDAALPHVRIVDGGKERQDSVRNGLEALDGDTEIVAIHDAARPFVPLDAVGAAIEAAADHGAATVAIPAVDTILQASEAGMLEATPDRARLWACQTPQVFRVAVIRGAHAQARAQHFAATDDATLAQRCGAPVKLIPGTPENFKITTPFDLERAEAMIRKERRQMRIGAGYDLHRLIAGRPLLLGGVEIPHEKGLEGHSDADALCHALTDAILGAAALGDIGQLFPDTDPAYQGADSMELLRKAYARAREAGYRLVNVDSTIIAQRPKLAPHIPAIRAALGEALKIDVDCISVKAKTNEGLGPEGREEAISVHASALMSRG
jgi:2-C-methyl-D-erythritol 4-phosphate cytidylyltransferase / 2-C-methyl-D-erythritol 2,4-cyclodiphosphate synthase